MSVKSCEFQVVVNLSVTSCLRKLVSFIKMLNNEYSGNQSFCDEYLSNQSFMYSEILFQQIPTAEVLAERSDRRVYFLGMIFAATLPLLSMFLVL